MLLQEPHKPVLADAIWQLFARDASAEIPLDRQYILDGGALVQRIPWPYMQLSTRISADSIYIT